MKEELISLEGNVKENKGITNVRKIKGKIRKNRKVNMGDQEEVYDRTNKIFVHNFVQQNMHVQVQRHHESLLR